jgi:hypothetical protein
MIKSRRMRCGGHVTQMEEIRNAYSTLIGKQEGKWPLQDLGVDGTIILEWICRKNNEECGLNSSGSGSTTGQLL